MANLPPNGLIVSCYLESMKGAERDFISAVAHVPGVVALRVEGIDNIEFARRIAPDQFIIGLVKQFDGFRNIITPDLLSMGREIIHAGADMVAAENILAPGIHPGYYREDGINIPFAVMWDMNQDEVLHIQDHSGDPARVRGMARENSIILATTFTPKAFDQVVALRKQFPDVPINLEGGIDDCREVLLGYEAGANYVTIGKAINDPVTIINNLLEGKYANT